MEFNGQNMEIVNKLQKEVRHFLKVDFVSQGVVEFEEEGHES